MAIYPDPKALLFCDSLLGAKVFDEALLRPVHRVEHQGLEAVAAGGERGDRRRDRVPGDGALEAHDIEVVGAALGIEEDGGGELAGQRRLADALGAVEDGLLGAGDGSPAEGEGGLARRGGSVGCGGVHDGPGAVGGLSMWVGGC
jgi:hypothetical protein